MIWNIVPKTDFCFLSLFTITTMEYDRLFLADDEGRQLVFLFSRRRGRLVLGGKKQAERKAAPRH